MLTVDKYAGTTPHSVLSRVLEVAQYLSTQYYRQSKPAIGNIKVSDALVGLQIRQTLLSWALNPPRQPHSCRVFAVSSR